MSKNKYTVNQILEMMEKDAETTATTTLEQITPEPVKVASVPVATPVTTEAEKIAAEEKVAEWVAQGEIIGRTIWDTLNKLAEEAMDKAAAVAVAQTPPPVLPTNAMDRSLPEGPTLPTNGTEVVEQSMAPKVAEQLFNQIFGDKQ